MSERSVVQLIPTGLPIWQGLIHHLRESLTVAPLAQVSQLMDGDVFQAVRVLGRQLGVG